jgi:PKD repeat protein
MKTKKTILGLIVTLGLLVMLLVPVASAVAGNPQVSIVPAATNIPVGGVVNVNVNIADVTNFDVAQYDVTYDPAVIEVTGVDGGAIGGTPIPVAMWSSNSTTTIRIINNVTGTTGVSGSGSLAVIHFHVTGAVGSSSAIDVHGGLLGNNQALEITADWVNSSVQVVTGVTASIIASKTEVLIGQQIVFTASPSGGSGNYAYAWDFENDGSIENTTISTTHSFASASFHTVALTVTDNIYGGSTQTTNVITVYAALEAGASASVAEAAVGEAINFTSSVTGGKENGGYTYAWDFGNGAGTSSAANPAYTYTAPGTYHVTLTVTDALGNPDTANLTIVVYQRGDANKDNIVDDDDLAYIGHIIMGHAGYATTTWSDANGDGAWNGLDLTRTELNFTP